MLQKKAREITEGAMAEQRNQYLLDCAKWVKNVTDTKIRKRALKGLNNIEIKTPKKFNRSRVAEQFTGLGYEVKAITSQKNRLLIKW